MAADQIADLLLYISPRMILRGSSEIASGGRCGDVRSRVGVAGLTAVLLFAGACGDASDRGVAIDSPDDPRSIVLIVLDTVRADHLGSHGYPRQTSPHFDRWAESGVLFERAIASSSWTLPSFASIYTGQHPAQHEAGEHLEGEGLRISGIDETRTTLAEHFFEAGFATAAFANNPFLHRKFGVARGFTEYSFVPANNRDIRNAEKTVTLALEWIDRQPRGPFFVMIHLFDPHMDYDPPQEVRGRFTRDYTGSLEFPVSDGVMIRTGQIVLDARDRDYVTGSYDEELLYTDSELGRLLDGLAARRFFDAGVAIVTADHGEELFDHGSFEHGHAAYQELLHVPLLILGASDSGSRVTTPVSHVDLYPTLLEIGGLDVGSDLPGDSLLPLILDPAAYPTDRPILADRTLHGRRHRVLIRWPWKAIDVEGKTEAMLFDLARDPREQDDLAHQHPERLRAMLDEFERRSPTPDREADERAAIEFDEALQAQLEALGYAEPSGEASKP